MNVPEPKCPHCGGALWDNRDSKRTPKSPDYRCKDQDCGTAIWLKPGGGWSVSQPKRSAR